jgi:hypothetical protein
MDDEDADIFSASSLQENDDKMDVDVPVGHASPTETNLDSSMQEANPSQPEDFRSTEDIDALEALMNEYVFQCELGLLLFVFTRATSYGTMLTRCTSAGNMGLMPIQSSTLMCLKW